MNIVTRTRREKQQEVCSHPDRVTTRNFGLERVVCVSCGKVEMHYRESLERDSARRPTRG